MPVSLSINWHFFIQDERNRDVKRHWLRKNTVKKHSFYHLN